MTTEITEYQPDTLTFREPETEKKLFVVNKILNQKETRALVSCILPNTLIPGEFIALCKLHTVFGYFVKEVCKIEEQRLIGDFIFEERALLRDEKKRPWNRQTRRPFRGIIDRVKPTFREKLELGKIVVDKLGVPAIELKKSNRGPKLKHDLKKVIPLIFAKGMRNFEDLSREAQNIGYDTTIKGTKETAGHTYLHNIFQLIPLEYYQEGLKFLDELSAELYILKFYVNVNELVGDNSAITCESLSERDVALELRLIRDIQPFFALNRIHTNTIRYIGKATNKIRSIMSYIPTHSKLYLDREYDVEDNYWVGIENEIEIQIRMKDKGRIRSAGRKKGKKMFDRKKYRKRKLGERIFGNLTKRRVKCYYKNKNNRLKGCILLGIEHNIIAYYKNKRWCELFVELEL